LTWKSKQEKCRFVEIYFPQLIYIVISLRFIQVNKEDEDEMLCLIFPLKNLSNIQFINWKDIKYNNIQRYISKTDYVLVIFDPSESVLAAGNSPAVRSNDGSNSNLEEGSIYYYEQSKSMTDK
jgi:hypothetical protein